MRLSETIRLGSLLVLNPEAGNINACAITMAALAGGFQQRSKHAWYQEVVKEWPWLNQTRTACPCKTGRHALPHYLKGAEIIWQPFDCHVAGSIHDYRMTIDQFADWIASIEPPETENEGALRVDRDDLLMCEVEGVLKCGASRSS